MAEQVNRPFNKFNVHAGDEVSCTTGVNAPRYLVKRVNRVTVTVATGHSRAERLPYREIRAVRCNHGVSDPHDPHPTCG